MTIKPSVNDGPYRWLFRGLIGLQQMIADCAEARIPVRHHDLDNLDKAINDLVASRNVLAMQAGTAYWKMSVDLYPPVVDSGEVRRSE